MYFSRKIVNRRINAGISNETLRNLDGKKITYVHNIDKVGTPEQHKSIGMQFISIFKCNYDRWSYLHILDSVMPEAYSVQIDLMQGNCGPEITPTYFVPQCL